MKNFITVFDYNQKTIQIHSDNPFYKSKRNDNKEQIQKNISYFIMWFIIILLLGIIYSMCTYRASWFDINKNRNEN